MSSTDRKAFSSSSTRRSEPARVNHMATSTPVISAYSAHSAITDADRVGFTGLNDQQ